MISLRCWCGCSNLKVFSEYYLRCIECNTLVSINRMHDEFYKGNDSNGALYGKEYWTVHVKENLGFPDIYERARADLIERDAFWLREILKYKLPPGRSLELGCAHGGSVYLMHLAGFDAAGAEMSEWICEYAQQAFSIPMFCGEIEEIAHEIDGYDVITMMDVLEHMPNPVHSLQVIYPLLKDDGLLVAQTPCWRSIGRSYNEMQVDNEMFLLHLKEVEHLYLYNQLSITTLLNKAGFPYVDFQPSIFSHDMFVFASKKPLKMHSRKEVEDFLLLNTQRRTALAFIDAYEKIDEYKKAAVAARSELQQRAIIADSAGIVRSGKAKFKLMVKKALGFFP